MRDRLYSHAKFVVIKVIHFLGLILARSPEVLSRALAAALGDLIYFLPTKRRRSVLANLHHAFPEMTEGERRRIARTSCRRTMEMGLFVLVSPHFSKKQLMARFSIDENFEREIQQNAAKPEPAVVIVPHLCLMESLTILPALTGGSFPEVGTVYRPLKQAAIEDWVLRTRQRFGLRLLSRKEGFAEAIQMVRDNKVIGILFDQNAGNIGVLSTFMGRVCSTTELPGMLAARYKTRIGAVWTERTGFWRGVIKLEELAKPSESIDVVFAANQWFEGKLRSEEKFRTDWLWLHERWRTQDEPERRLQLKHRRNALEDEMAWRGWESLPRQTRIWIRLPNWLGDVIMAMPLIRAIREGRPDAEITVLARGQFRPLLEAFPIADRLITLPDKGSSGAGKFFRDLALEYPDTQILFTNSFRGDHEAKRIGAPQRFGILRPGKPRPLLTHHWELPAGFDEATVHQTELWRQFLAEFGLKQKPNFAPYTAAELTGVVAPTSRNTIGLICGTENEPAKRWPVSHWRALIEKFPDEHFTLFGTANDRAITNEVASGFDESRVINRAGKTNLMEFASELLACRVLVTNDTGGMHLANALGVPVIVVFGPTNPIRTGPCFDAPRVLLQPPNCAPTGGGDISQVTPEVVGDSLTTFLQESAAHA
ncbi:glycosyltransferase family 9 protein [Cerasicoccus fimbriatus]|uniref:LpxL/LpxP family acyltransferase n=1 Tax=Cerasicoccus fimbriatus TaxID=3014554 RepID=UPI0022B3D14F|nr:glycosyltransferase family 9 protein [Cerasicoccus sp. TK19100]